MRTYYEYMLLSDPSPHFINKQSKSRLQRYEAFLIDKLAWDRSDKFQHLKKETGKKILSYNGLHISFLWAKL